jgi:hypothetical protein
MSKWNEFDLAKFEQAAALLTSRRAHSRSPGDATVSNLLFTHATGARR